MERPPITSCETGSFVRRASSATAAPAIIFLLDRMGNPFAAVSLRRNLVVGAGILWVAMVGGLLWMALNELPLVAL